MLHNRERLTRQIIGAIRRGPQIPRETIDPYTHQARALVGVGPTGPHDPILVRMGRRLEGRPDVTLLDNFFFGTPEDGLFQLRERPQKGQRAANTLPTNHTSLFEAPGLLAPIRVRHGSTGHNFEGFNYGALGCPGPFTLLPPNASEALLQGLNFFALPEDYQIQTLLAMPNGNCFVVRTRQTFNGPIDEYYFGKPDQLVKMKTIKPERNDPHGGPFSFYIETADGRFMRFIDENDGWGYLGENQNPTQVAVHEFLETHKLVFPQE